jgi:nucleotide-binding universal stress UspA family protein
MAMKLLVAVDGSGPATLAAMFARRLARESPGMGVVILAVEKSGDPGKAADGAREACSLFEEEDIAFTLEVLEGNAPEVIVRRAQEHECDFIVMGARGLGAMREVLLGSVSSAVLKNASVPVTIVQ